MTLEASGASAAIAGRVIVDGVDLGVRPGTITALIGPNGAGKSTLIHLLAGISTPTAGRILLDGRDLAESSRRERALAIALIEQDATTEISMTVQDVVALGRTPHQGPFAGVSADDRAVVSRALDLAGASGFVGRAYSTLSGGERQRVQLARALAQQPRTLLLDEPTSHLDVNAQLATLELLRSLAAEGELGLLVAIHDLNLAASYADTIVVLDRGMVVAAGPPAEILTAELIGAVYGVTATVLTHPLTQAPLIAFSAASRPTAERT